MGTAAPQHQHGHSSVDRAASLQRQGRASTRMGIKFFASDIAAFWTQQHLKFRNKIFSSTAAERSIWRRPPLPRGSMLAAATRPKRSAAPVAAHTILQVPAFRAAELKTSQRTHTNRRSVRYLRPPLPRVTRPDTAKRPKDLADPAGVAACSPCAAHRRSNATTCGRSFAVTFAPPVDRPHTIPRIAAETRIQSRTVLSE